MALCAGRSAGALTGLISGHSNEKPPSKRGPQFREGLMLMLAGIKGKRGGFNARADRPAALDHLLEPGSRAHGEA